MIRYFLSAIILTFASITALGADLYCVEAKSQTQNSYSYRNFRMKAKVVQGLILNNVRIKENDQPESINSLVTGRVNPVSKTISLGPIIHGDGIVLTHTLIVPANYVRLRHFKALSTEHINDGLGTIKLNGSVGLVCKIY